ncbi:MAG: hypothetical protein IKE92_14805 [Clostridiales bacterium]|nr:hypothetical protein [Clostridiales bacterium]
MEKLRTNCRFYHRVHFGASWNEMRNYCIARNFYNCGTNEEYANLLTMLREVPDLSGLNHLLPALESLACDILDHTSTDNWPLNSDYEDNVKELMSMFLELHIVQIWFD